MRKRDRTEEAHDFSGLPAPKALTPADVQAKEFGVSRFGGYKMRDVDEFLDELTASMTRLTEENERLRSGAIVAPAIGAPDLADSARQADEIIEGARAEAARIVQGAEDQAATAAGTMSAGDRAAVTAFLAREREFLQSLAGLVQGHAETIKGMAKASRPARPSGAAEPAETSTASSGAPAAAAAGGAASTEAPPSEASERAEGSSNETADVSQVEERSGDPDTTPPPAPEEPIRVEEPAPASVTRNEGDDEPDPGKAEGDPSLRELFWGED